MSALIQYENYTQPFMGFGQEGSSWFRRNWPFVIKIVGLAFVAGGMIARRFVDRQVPKEVKMSVEEWTFLITSLENVYPKMPRAQIERKLCEVFGDRIPFCVSAGVSTLLPSVTVHEEGEPSEGLPSWIWMAAIGVGAVLLLK